MAFATMAEHYLSGLGFGDRALWVGAFVVTGCLILAFCLSTKASMWSGSRDWVVTTIGFLSATALAGPVVLMVLSTSTVTVIDPTPAPALPPFMVWVVGAFFTYGLPIAGLTAFTRYWLHRTAPVGQMWQPWIELAVIALALATATLAAFLPVLPAYL